MVVVIVFASLQVSWVSLYLSNFPLFGFLAFPFSKLRILHYDRAPVTIPLKGTGQFESSLFSRMIEVLLSLETFLFS